MKRAMFYAGMAALLVVALFSATAQAAIDKELDSVCLIHAGDGASNWTGSGTACARAHGYIYVLTACHVAPQGVVTCAFAKDSYISERLRGEVCQANGTLDASMIGIPEAAFGGIFPHIVPLGEYTDLPKAGGRADTVGCPYGAMPTGEKLHVIGYEQGGRIIFGPRPEMGRSGSAIFASDGSKIIGIVSAFYNGSAVNGGGTGPTCSMIREQLWPAMKTAAANFKPCDAVLHQKAELVPCAADDDPRFRLIRRGGECGPGGCNPPAPGPATGPWPAELKIETAKDDLKPIVDNQNKIVDALNAISVHLNTPAPTPVAAPDPQTVATLNQHGQAINDLGNQFGQFKSDVPKMIDAGVKPVSDQVAKIDAAVKPIEEIKAKLDAQIAKGGLQGKIASDIENATGSDEGLRKVLITIGIVLGIVAFVVFAVFHTIRTGRGPSGDIIDKLAAANPSNQLLATMKSQVDALDTKIAGIGNALPNLAMAGTAAATGATPVGVAAALQLLQQQVAALVPQTAGPAVVVHAGSGAVVAPTSGQ